MRRVALARAITTGFWLATAGYAFLSAIPFASEQFLKPGLVPAVTLFATRHAWFSAGALGAAAAALAPWIRSGHAGVRALTGAWGVITLALFGLPSLATVEPATWTLALGFLALLPAVWISLVDVRTPERVEPAEPPDSSTVRDFLACALAGGLVTVGHGIRAIHETVGFGAGAAAAQFARVLLLHLVLFAAIFAALSVVRGLARLTSRPAASEAWLGRLCVAFGAAGYLWSVLLPALSFTGRPASLVALSVGGVLALAVGPRATRAAAGLDQSLTALVPRWATGSRVGLAVWPLMLIGLIAWGDQAVAESDWNFTVAKFLALASWLVALAYALRAAPAVPTGRPLVPFVACLVVLGGQQASERAIGSAAGVADPVGGAWVGRDPSTRLISDALAPAARADLGFFDFLQLHTNISRRVDVKPVSVDWAPLDGQPASSRPHIFVFVVDSLRRDYLSPYNVDVSFTPSVAKFAAESTVFERAFTRYGATGLSVPALWVGGLVLHKQYVTPFAPMNALAKLLAHERYAQWISMDNILEVILPKSDRLDPLDSKVAVPDFRLCRTLDEVRGRLDRVTADGPPIFVYSLPQDLHVSVIAREGGSSIDQQAYDGFHAAYASRVRRLDACFGAFIDDLKTRGLYDESLIMLTSDHGDSLGEEGRMGHAYTIFPEIVQIPLVVHVPSSARTDWRADPTAAAFSSDLTPTIYRLLGYEPRAPAPLLFGRPLFEKMTTGDPAPPLDSSVVASSYGSVYGALLDNARRLYIVDGVALQEHAYEMDGTAAGRATAVRAEDREAGQRAIREAITEVARFYGYHPATSTALRE